MTAHPLALDVVRHLESLAPAMAHEQRAVILAMALGVVVGRSTAPALPDVAALDCLAELIEATADSVVANLQPRLPPCSGGEASMPQPPECKSSAE